MMFVAGFGKIPRFFVICIGDVVAISVLAVAVVIVLSVSDGDNNFTAISSFCYYFLAFFGFLLEHTISTVTT